MRTVSVNLKADIMAGTIANCLKLTLQSGTVYAYTDHDEPVIVGAVTYLPAPGLQKIKYTNTANVEVSNQEFGAAWVDVPEADLLSGKFDQVKVEVAWVSWKNPSYGKLVVFSGELGSITWSEEGFKADIVNFMKNLSLNIGTIFTANCRHSLYSAASTGKVGACTLNKASYTFTGSVASIVTPKWSFIASGLSNPTGYFDGGEIKFTSGLNSGSSVVIKRYAAGQIDMFLPTGFIIAPGDTFEAYAGCDKTLATCKTKFNNVINFGGFPHIQQDVSFR